MAPPAGPTYWGTRLINQAAALGAHVGISGMNGYSDQSEVTTAAIWTSIRNWANTNHLTRLVFWLINRDRRYAGGGVQESCSGISQADWAFTGITGGFTG